MKLTNRSEYALLALVFLARNGRDGSYISVDTIATAQGIPFKFLEQILLTLKSGKFLRSAKGQRGGYTLARPANQISLAEVIRLIDGALAPTESVSKYYYEPTPIEKESALVRVFLDIRDYIADKLEHTMLADVI
ncbi:MAG: Rrf2 family transcriptional regulator [Smithellaceae bacterium]|nr:Rrf2 family transcriptional regulator [Syntrophaceae bacterium]MDD4242168.1 Rrf2 family transcriptional regulator [Smithellaceae bacterium]